MLARVCVVWLQGSAFVFVCALGGEERRWKRGGEQGRERNREETGLLAPTAVTLCLLLPLSLSLSLSLAPTPTSAHEQQETHRDEHKMENGDRERRQSKQKTHLFSSRGEPADTRRQCGNRQAVPPCETPSGTRTHGLDVLDERALQPRDGALAVGVPVHGTAAQFGRGVRCRERTLAHSCAHLKRAFSPRRPLHVQQRREACTSLWPQSPWARLLRLLGHTRQLQAGREQMRDRRKDSPRVAGVVHKRLQDDAVKLELGRCARARCRACPPAGDVGPGVCGCACTWVLGRVVATDNARRKSGTLSANRLPLPHTARAR